MSEVPGVDGGRRGGRAPRSFFWLALLFESALGVVAVAAGWALGLPAEVLDLTPHGGPLSAGSAVAAGLLAALPLLAGLLLLDRHPPPVLRTFREQIDHLVVPLFRPLSTVQLAALAAAAGLGEELLFRGLLQSGLAHAVGGAAGAALALVAASLLFGLCHFLNLTYAALAGLVGLYFGALLLLGQHLLVPVVAHGAYDFCALVYLTRRSSVP